MEIVCKGGEVLTAFIGGVNIWEMGTTAGFGGERISRQSRLRVWMAHTELCAVSLADEAAREETA